MSNDNAQFDPELDALLATAHWPEPTPQAVGRLRDEWHGLIAPRPMRIRWLAAAAVLLLVIGGTWVWLRTDRPTTVAVVTVPVVAMPITSPPPTPTHTTSLIVAQAPTPAERLAILAVSGPVVNAKNVTRDAIDAMVRDETDAAEAKLRSLTAVQAERELAMAFATTPDADRRRAAIKLLVPIASANSAALLNRAARDPKFADDAMPAVARLGGMEALLPIIRTGQPAVRRLAIAQILGLASDVAVQEFLAMVLDERTRDDALAALHAAPQAPAEALIAALDDARVDRRFAAAKALGSLCDRPDVGAALRRMVNDNHNRREALAALLSCPDARAARFLAAARARPAIDSDLRVVQTELQRIF